MKRVGVILRQEDVTGVMKHYVRDSLLNKLANYNIEVLCIPIINKITNVFKLIELCNGIILPGGDDIADSDLKIIEYLYQKDIPTLGICLGMQEIAVNNKGALIDLNNLKHYNTIHNINIKSDSLLFKIIKKNRIQVNSIHKSIVIQTDLDISAISEDNIVEAIEDKTKKFFLGVQWHPERMEGKESDLLFDYFISKL